MRIIIILILFFLIYKVFKYLLINNISNNKSDEGFEEMVKDIECNRYILKKGSSNIRIKGEILYFCSDECLKKFKNKRR